MANSIITRKTKAAVHIGGNEAENLLSVRCDFGWDQSDSTARFDLFELPSSWEYGANVEIYIGEVDDAPLRFTGYLREWDFSHYPKMVSGVCGGPLYLLDTYENITETDDGDYGKPGLDIDTLTGGQTATLKAIVKAVLDIVGVSYSDGNLADPGHIYGLVGPEAFTWHTGETALSYLHRLFEASEGYRLFGSGDGTVYMAQIKGEPGSSSLTLAEGVDIISGSAKHSTIKTRGQILVEGYDDGGGPATGTAGSGVPPYRVSSNLIEDDDFASDIATYWSGELGRTIVDIDIDTWRLDVIGPAQTHTINAVERLQVQSDFYVIGNSIESSSTGMITQHIKYVGNE